ncbi:MAG: hypothetical protein ACKPJN_22550, partial [Microcystis panniformis]
SSSTSSLTQADGEPVEPPRKLLSNAQSKPDLTAEAYTLPPGKTFCDKPYLRRSIFLKPARI